MPTYVFKCPKCKKELTRDFPRRPKSLRTLCSSIGEVVRARYVRTLRKRAEK